MAYKTTAATTTTTPPVKFHRDRKIMWQTQTDTEKMVTKCRMMCKIQQSCARNNSTNFGHRFCWSHVFNYQPFVHSFIH